MPARRTLIASLVSLALLAGCGDDDDGATDTTTTTEAATSTTAVRLEQPAVWPAADVVFETPEEAASDFVSQVLGVPPTLGGFQQGDNRSGEIELLSPGEGGGARVVRSVLLLRQLGPDDGWFVLAAIGDPTSISAPEAGDDVPAGPTTVRGQGRGFEGSLVVSALRAGEPEPLDDAVTQGGAMADPLPFEVTLDLSDARPGDTVVLLVRGGTGLETDPGELSAIPVTIAG